MPVQACVLTLEVTCVNRTIETHVYTFMLSKPLLYMYVQMLHVVYYSNITDGSMHVFHYYV